jgi:predicted hydrolase (HD superfamily)
MAENIMAENTMKAEVSFQSLLETISSLGMAEKHQLWEFLEAELFPDEEDSPEDIAEIQAAHADYLAGDYMTFEQYRARRAERSA